MSLGEQGNQARVFLRRWPNHRLQATGNSLRSYVASAAPRA